MIWPEDRCRVEAYCPHPQPSYYIHKGEKNKGVQSHLAPSVFQIVAAQAALSVRCSDLTYSWPAPQSGHMCPSPFHPKGKFVPHLALLSLPGHCSAEVFLRNLGTHLGSLSGRCTYAKEAGCNGYYRLEIIPSSLCVFFFLIFSFFFQTGLQ